MILSRIMDSIILHTTDVNGSVIFSLMAVAFLEDWGHMTDLPASR